MPRWLGRLLWALRGKRRVRIHLKDNDPSLEGILAGRWGGHYILLASTILSNTDDKTYALEGHAEVPAERVLFVQVLSK